MLENNVRPHVVVIGAGFGGLKVVRALRDRPVDITLIDRANFHTFLPLLYQVAAAELEPEQIAQPVRSILRDQDNVRFTMAEVDDIDFVEHTIYAGDHAIGYDYLVLALGSTAHYFGVEGASAFAFPLKSLEQSIALRSHILRSFEEAAVVADPQERRRLLTFVIAGGGPTGVEYAGALAELVHGPLAKDFPRLDLSELQIILVEMMPHLLSGLERPLGEYAAARLARMGIDVRLETAVQRVERHAVELANGDRIATDTVVWTAGVRGAPLAERLGLPLARGGRVAVDATLQVAGRDNVFVIGDLAYFEQDGAALPLVAPVAIQMGERVATNIMQHLEDRPLSAFQYVDKGQMATIGRNAAVAQVFGRQFTGFPAWIMWLAVHLFQLIGFRNRLAVMLNWAWDYFFFERVARLVLPYTLAGRDADRAALHEDLHRQEEPAAA